MKKIRVQGAGMFKRLFHGAGRDFVELDALEVLRLALEKFGNMPGNGLALAIGVRCEIRHISLTGFVLEVADDIFLIGDNLVLWLEAELLVHTQRL